MPVSDPSKTKAITVDDDATTLSTSALGLVNALRARNCSVDKLLQEADIDPSLLTQMGKRIPIRKMEVFWKAAVRETGDPSIGIAVVENYNPNFLHAFYHVIQACNQAGDAMRQMVRFSAVISTVVEIELFEHLNEVELCFKVRDGYPAPCDEAMDAVAAITLYMSTEYLGLENDDITIIMLPRITPDKPELWELGLSAPVSFGSDFLRIRYKTSVLDKPLITASPEIADTNSELLQRYLQGLSQNFVARAKQHLMKQLSSGQISQEALAAEMNMSSRNLQRRLQSEETSFRILLDEIRHQQAVSEIKRSTRPVTDIAHDLGFADSASFSRAFKRWTGVTPSYFRKNHSSV